MWGWWLPSSDDPITKRLHWATNLSFGRWAKTSEQWLRRSCSWIHLMFLYSGRSFRASSCLPNAYRSESVYLSPFVGRQILGVSYENVQLFWTILRLQSVLQFIWEWCFHRSDKFIFGVLRWVVPRGWLRRWQCSWGPLWANQSRNYLQIADSTCW